MSDPSSFPSFPARAQVTSLDTMADWKNFFGEQVRTKDGLKSTDEVFNGKKVVGLYFSAHWCPPCRQFTPFLGAVYEDMIEEHPEFELVFVSSDQSTAQYEEYYEEIPFKAIPFDNRAVKDALSRKYGVTGIPMLIFLNEKGEVISTDGRQIVAQSQGDIEAVWSKLTQ